MDKATWEMRAQAVIAIKKFNYCYGKTLADIQLNSYRKLSLQDRINRVDELLSLSRKFSDFFDALDLIANYHAGNKHTEKEIPPKLAVWGLYQYTGFNVDRPDGYPNGMRLLSRRDMVIIHGMIVLMDFEGMSLRGAADIVSKVIFRSPERVIQIWKDARDNRDNPDKPEYMGFFKHHAGDGAKQIYQAWKAAGYPVIDASV